VRIVPKISRMAPTDSLDSSRLPHDLRHFYASMLIDQRVNLKHIQTTLNVYGHLIERVEAAAQERTSVLSVLKRSFFGRARSDARARPSSGRSRTVC
jgi:integrase